MRKGKLLPWVGLAVRLTAAGIWLFAGITKLADLDGFRAQVAAYQVLPHALVSPCSYGLPLVEVAIGAYLLVGAMVRPTAILACVLMVVFLVAEARGKPIGTIVGGWDGWRGHMARLAVSPYLRRSGVARSLVDEAEKRLRKRGAKRIYALIDRRNELGKSFWAAAGYTVNDDLVLYTKNIELDEEPG